MRLCVNIVLITVQLFAYGQSEYVRAFGMEIDPAKIPLEVGARILDPPAIQYKGQGNATTKIVCDGPNGMSVRLM